METPKIDTGWYGHEGFVVKVGHGDNLNSYFLHRGYACYSSKYFEDLYTDLKRAIIEVDFSAEHPDIVYHFAHWLYPKYLPLLAEQNVNVGIVETVNRLFVFAEKYWIQELATECYRKVRMLFAHPAGGVVSCERVKGLYDQHSKKSSMMKTFYLRLMVQRFSAQEVAADVMFLEGCFEGEPEFAKDFFAELREHIKWRRAHPFHDRDLENYLPPPLVDWWGEEEVVSVTDEGDADQRRRDLVSESAIQEEPRQNWTGESETRRSADEASMDLGYLDHVAKEAKTLLDPVAHIDLISSPEGRQTNASAGQSAMEIDERNDDQEMDRVSLNPPQQNGTSEAKTSSNADHVPPLTPLESSHADEQDKMSAEEPTAKKPEPRWINIRVEDHTPSIKPESILHEAALQGISATSRVEPTHPRTPISDLLDMDKPTTPLPVQAVAQPPAPSSQTVRQSSPPPIQTVRQASPQPSVEARSQPAGQNFNVQENGTGSTNHPTGPMIQGFMSLQSNPRGVPRSSPPPPPMPPKPAPSIPLKGKDLAAQVLGYQAGYPSVQRFLEEFVPDPTAADLYKVQDILRDNAATHSNFNLLKILFDPGDTIRNYPSMPPKEPKRKGRPPKQRKTFPGETVVTTAAAERVPRQKPPTVARNSGSNDVFRSHPFARKPGPSQATRSSEEFQDGGSDGSDGSDWEPTSKRVRKQDRGREKEKEKEAEEPRPRRSLQRQSSAVKERKRMWDDFKIED